MLAKHQNRDWFEVFVFVASAAMILMGLAFALTGALFMLDGKIFPHGLMLVVGLVAVAAGSMPMGTLTKH